MRKRFGFTLVEIIISVALIGAVMIMGGSVLDFSLRSLRYSLNEFEFQYHVRYAAGWAVSRIRFATAVFTIPESSFRPDNLAPGWSYYGVEQLTSGSTPTSRIVHYIWDPSIGINGGHRETEIIKPREGISFRMIFYKERTLVDSGGLNERLDEGDLLDFDILGYVRGNTSSPHMVIKGTTLPANALQSVDNGTEFHRATAIAYRVEERPPAFVGHIAMVLDTSGSMAWDMDGAGADGAPPAIGPSRMDILKEAATRLIRDLSEQSNIDIAIIPFDNWASPHDWVNIQQGVTGAAGPNNNPIYQVNDLAAVGGTNTGDGLRRAFFKLRDHGLATTSGIPKRFIIVLVDGDSNLVSTVPIYDLRFPTSADFYEGEGDLTYLRRYFIRVQTGIAGNWGYPSPHQIFYPTTQPFAAVFQPIVGENVIKWGQRFLVDDFARPFVIVFSSSVSDDGIDNIGDAFNLDLYHPDMFRATEAQELTNAFQAIRDSILNEMWHLNGPSL